MKKRLLSILLMCCMVLTLLPTTAFAEGSAEEPPVCSCETACTADNMNKECPVCGAENAIPQNCGQYIPVEDRTGENGSTERADDPNGPIELSAADQVQAMINGLPNAEEITEDNAEEVKAQLEAIDEAKEKLSDEEIDELDMTRYAEAAAALGALAAPMLLANDSPDEQFSLAPGGRYYFDLSAMNIPGTANGDLPDSTLHYVPFTYAGTVDAYKLTSAMATTEEHAEQNKYDHSLFIADYNVTFNVDWNQLNEKQMIFGTPYTSYGVNYTMRAPSAGSQSNNNNGKDDSSSTRGIPKSNEWDAILDKANQDWKDNTSGYIKNWSRKYSFGQDNHADASYRAIRGCNSARYWGYYTATYSLPNVGFRPVLEILNADTLDSDGLKVVTLDLNGGKLGGSSDAIHIIVKNGSAFTAPASDGLTRPDGNTGSYFMWLGSDGKLYAPGASVPADVTKLTAQFALSEQFSLKPGGRYYFDLSAMNIPGKVNGRLPDSTLHYVPFTYAGTIEAYKLTSAMATTEEYAEQNKYPHSLFVADYAVTHTVSWDDLNTAGLIFGKDYAAGGVDYTLRAPSVGSGRTYSGESQRGTPLSNEWDKILDKDSGYIKNWSERSSWGQDTKPDNSFPIRANRGDHTARHWNYDHASISAPHVGIRPVLELPTDLAADNLKVVELRTVKFMPGEQQNWINIIVKNGKSFKAPAAEGLPRPDGNTGSYFMWLDGNGKSYEPGDSVPEVVTTLTAQWTVNQYTITYDLAGGTVEGNPDTYTIETVAFTLKNPTKSGYTFTGWSGTGLTGENNMTVTIPKGSTGERSYTAHWRYNGGGSGGSSSYPITVPGKTENGTLTVSPRSAEKGDSVTITVKPDSGYQLDDLAVTDKNGKELKLTDKGNGKYTFTMPSGKVKINATFTKEAEPSPFSDVSTSAYYYEAVKWAAENGITGGVGNSLFAPNQPCTRAQIVTFLWRAAGSPVVNYLMPFTDVDEGAYYAEAVRWAASCGIVTGQTETTFGTDSVCTRAQAAAMIYRCAQAQGKGFTGAWMFHLPFTDVPEWAYESVAWCYMNGVTTGVSETSFAPGNDCTRAQIVTFLWRAFSK